MVKNNSVRLLLLWHLSCVGTTHSTRSCSIPAPFSLKIHTVYKRAEHQAKAFPSHKHTWTSWSLTQCNDQFPGSCQLLWAANTDCCSHLRTLIVMFRTAHDSILQCGNHFLHQLCYMRIYEVVCNTGCNCLWHLAFSLVTM